MHARRTRTGTLARCAQHVVGRFASTDRTLHGRNDIPVFFHTPPGRAGDFLLRGQEKSHQREGHPGAAPFVHPWTKSTLGPAWLADAPSLARRQVGAVPCAHPAGLIARSSPQHRGPVGAHPARSYASWAEQREAQHRWPPVGLPPDQVRGQPNLHARPWTAANEAKNAPLHDAEKRSRSREQGAHVRGHGWPSSRRRAIDEHRRKVELTRCRRDRHARRNGFGHFCRNKSGPLAAEASGTQYGHREPGKTGFRARPFGPPRNDGGNWTPNFAGMTICKHVGKAHCRCAS